MQSEDNADKKALAELNKKLGNNSGITNLEPKLNYISLYADLTAAYVPMRGKLDVMFNNKLHFELFLLGGVSLLKTDQDDKYAITWGLGENIYFNSTYSIRLDYITRMFQEKKGMSEVEVTRNLMSFSLALNYFF